MALIASTQLLQLALCRFVNLVLRSLCIHVHMHDGRGRDAIPTEFEQHAMQILAQKLGSGTNRNLNLASEKR